MMEGAIRSAMTRYFDSLYHSDAAAMQTLLHPRALYACASGPALVLETRDSYLAILRAREAPAVRGEVRADAIDEIHLVGHDTAFVRARCSIGERHFTDLLTWVRDEQQWRILAKVFHYEPFREEEPYPCPT